MTEKQPSPEEIAANINIFSDDEQLKEENKQVSSLSPCVLLLSLVIPPFSSHSSSLSLLPPHLTPCSQTSYPFNGSLTWLEKMSSFTFVIRRKDCLTWWRFDCWPLFLLRYLSVGLGSKKMCDTLWREWKTSSRWTRRICCQQEAVWDGSEERKRRAGTIVCFHCI